MLKCCLSEMSVQFEIHVASRSNHSSNQPLTILSLELGFAGSTENFTFDFPLGEFARIKVSEGLRVNNMR